MILRPWRRWPSEWPDTVPFREAFPRRMWRTTSWPYHWKVKSRPLTPDHDPVPAPEAVATWAGGFITGTEWRIQPSIIGHLGEVALRVQLLQRFGRPLEWVWSLTFFEDQFQTYFSDIVESPFEDGFEGSPTFIERPLEIAAVNVFIPNISMFVEFELPRRCGEDFGP